MNLSKKKALAARILKVGKARIKFDTQRIDEIKEAITSQDIRELFASKAIQIKEIKGRRKIVKRRTKRGPGKVKKKVKRRKKDYVILTRKLRAHSKMLKDKGSIESEEHKNIRKMIRASKFRSKAHLNEHVKEIKRK